MPRQAGFSRYHRDQPAPHYGCSGLRRFSLGLLQIKGLTPIAGMSAGTNWHPNTPVCQASTRRHCLISAGLINVAPLKAEARRVEEKGFHLPRCALRLAQDTGQIRQGGNSGALCIRIRAHAVDEYTEKA